MKMVVSPIWPSLRVEPKDKFVSALSFWGDDDLLLCSVAVAGDWDADPRVVSLEFMSIVQKTLSQALILDSLSRRNFKTYSQPVETINATPHRSLLPKSLEVEKGVGNGSYNYRACFDCTAILIILRLQRPALG
jgi:hypothetical protein